MVTEKFYLSGENNNKTVSPNIVNPQTPSCATAAETTG